MGIALSLRHREWLIVFMDFLDCFNINILQYVSIYDLLASIIYIVAIPVAILIVFSLLVQVMMIDAGTQKSEPIKRTTKFSNIKKMINNIMHLCLSAFMLYVMITTYNESEGIKKTIVALLIFLPAIMIISGLKTNFLGGSIPLSSTVLAVGIFTPIFLAMTAFTQADNIINGKDTYTVQSDSPCTSENNTQYRYISSISDKAFAISLKDSSICVFKYSYIKLIRERPPHIPPPSNRI
ncbi:MAG: hypothetical protein ACRCWW_16880 [Scandinavium sp.]|uniref:hypothetical protein n=1 Tax=Scandinavium sp. TaxID=2830653 RepID=UPI003F3AA8E3